jgi:SAM-dependent methyltransferase
LAKNEINQKEKKMSVSIKNTLSCAIITPIGPGHQEVYVNMCVPSINLAIAHGKGPFEKIECLPVFDIEGSIGRSEARNIGVEQAWREQYDWIFFLDADDLLFDGVFEAVREHIKGFDAVWGQIVATQYPDFETLNFRENQIKVIDNFKTLIAHDPFLTLQMGHFVRTKVARKHPFDAGMNTGEDVKYYLEIWKKYRCLKCESTFFINVRGNHSGGPKSADGQEWRVAVDKEILEARRQLTDSSNSLELTLEMFNPFKGRIAMVVAHPDDETLWGGGLLSRLFPIDIICCSIPRRDPERALDFFDAVRTMGHFPILMPFQEAEPSQLFQHMNHLDLSGYELVITHGKDGEYGHLHHKQVHDWIFEHFSGEIICFGFGQGNLKLSLNAAERETKITALKCYNKISPFDQGKPKWKALMEKYNIEETRELFEGSVEHRVSNTDISDTSEISKINEKLSPLNISEQEIRKNADYQHFEIENGKLQNVQGRMNVKHDAVKSFLPENWSGRSVLDIGCDFGFWSFLAATKGAKVIGLDRSRDLRGIGRINIPLLNNLASKRNNLDASFQSFEAGTNWHLLKKHDFVFCMSLYHHIFNVCEDHDAIWYWLWQNTGQTLLWENPTEMEDRVVQINLKEHLCQYYTETNIRSAALKYFDISKEQPALHETTRTVWHCVPKLLSLPKYTGTVISGAGGASKAFAYSEERRCKEFASATGVYPIPGSLNIQLDSEFDWNSGYYIANFLDVTNRKVGLDQEWNQRRARLYPVEIENHKAWVFKFESDTYPSNFVELISESYLRDIIDKSGSVTVSKI